MSNTFLLFFILLIFVGIMVAVSFTVIAAVFHLINLLIARNFGDDIDG